MCNKISHNRKMPRKRCIVSHGGLFIVPIVRQNIACLRKRNKRSSFISPANYGFLRFWYPKPALVLATGALFSMSSIPSSDPEPLLRLDAVGHSCLSVSMSVNWTACPPPLVLKTLPLINLVSISPSEASSWCLSTYFWHLDRAFSFGVDTVIALGKIGCMTESRSKLEAGLWSTHFSPPAECERRCIGWTGVPVWGSQRERNKPAS